MYSFDRRFPLIDKGDQFYGFIGKLQAPIYIREHLAEPTNFDGTSQLSTVYGGLPRIGHVEFNT